MRRLFWTCAEWLLGLAHAPEPVPSPDGGPQAFRCSRCGEPARSEHELLGGDDTLSWNWMQGKRR